jgi:hypothetical protein
VPILKRIFAMSLQLDHALSPVGKLSPTNKMATPDQNLETHKTNHTGATVYDPFLRCDIEVDVGLESLLKFLWSPKVADKGFSASCRPFVVISEALDPVTTMVFHVRTSMLYGRLHMILVGGT